MRMESTFAISMLETWEKVVIILITLLLVLLLFTGLIKYLPHHLVFLVQRGTYYFMGNDSGTAPIDVVTQDASWFGDEL